MPRKERIGPLCWTLTIREVRQITKDQEKMEPCKANKWQETEQGKPSTAKGNL